jgi:hypothetical protein
MRGRRVNYERDEATFSADAYTVSGWGEDIAFVVRGWETEPDEDTEWSGYEVRTGRIVVTMIGDDARHVVDIEDLTPLDREDYCGECGQVGCAHDGLDRDDSDNA